MAYGQVKYYFYFPSLVLKLMLIECFGLVLTFVKLAGTLNELCHILIVFLCNSDYCVVHRVQAKEISFQDQCDSPCIYTAASKGRGKKSHYHNNEQFVHHNYNRSRVTCWLQSLGNSNVITVLLQMSGGRGHFSGAIVERI